jgi:hypothetical protein
MSVFDTLADRRIREAQQRGEFDDLPGAGRPLDLADDALVPEDLRVAYRILKNAGFVPPELEAQCEIRRLEQLLACAEADEERARLVTRISFLFQRAAGRGRSLRVEQAYMEEVSDQLAARRR